MVVLKTLGCLALGTWLLTMSVQGLRKGAVPDLNWDPVHRADEPVMFWLQWGIFMFFGTCAFLAPLTFFD
jgi:hypothetical protein